MRRQTAIILCLMMWAVFRPVNLPAEAEAAYQATDWNRDMTLPPNSYRAAKPIGLEGNLTVKTQPGTLIDGVSFHTHGGLQHWHFEGSMLRRVHVTVKMNGGGHAIDSVLEDCDFNKDDNWFMFWWSTRWRFDNCIITKRFVRGDLPPLDYSAHAENCTFYGVKLPGVGFKENPASYLQKDEMVCKHCRFVDCDVPQTFLAATVDCVFESCRFEAKNKVNWPKETGPIKVKAFYAADGTEQSSFLNGPLSVEWAAAPRNVTFGSTLPHTQSGGRVTLTNARFKDQFVALGSVTKKASEVVDVAAATPSAPVAPIPVSNAISAPATGGEIHGLEEVLRAMPSNIEVIAGGEPNAAGVEAANRWLAQTCAGRPALMRMTLAGLQAVKEGDYTFETTARPQGILYHGATIPSQAVALFRPVNALPLRQVQLGADFSVRGIVRKAEFVGRGHALTFTLTVGEASVPDAVPSLPAPAAGTKPPPAYFGAAGPPTVPTTPPPPKAP